MRITELGIEGLKAASIRGTVQPLNLFVGPNGSGKSTYLEAVGWGLHGARPIDAIKPMIANGEARVALALDDGFGIDRGLTRDKSGTWRQALSFRKPGEAEHRTLGVEATQGIIEDHCGAFSAALNLGEFTSLSPEGKRAFILGLCESSHQSGPGLLMARLELALLDRLIEPTGSVVGFCQMQHGVGPELLEQPEVEALLVKLWPRVPDPVREQWAKMRAMLSTVQVEFDTVATVTNWIETAKVLKSEHRKGRDSAEAASRRLSADKNALADATAEPVEKIRAEIQTAQAELAGLDAELGRLAGHGQAVASAGMRVESATKRAGQIKTALEAARARLAGVDVAGEAARLRADGAALFNGNLDELNAAAMQGQTYHLQAQAEVTRLAAELTAADRAVSDLKRDLDNATQNLERERQDPWHVARGLALALAAAIIDNPAADARLGALLNHIEQQAAGALERCGQLQFECEALRMDLPDAEAEATAARSTLAEAQAVLADRLHGYQEQSESARAAVGRAREADALRARADRLEHEQQTAQAEAARLSEQLTQAEAEIEKATTDLATVTAESPGDSAGLSLRRNHTAEQVRALSNRLVAKEKAETLEAELAACIANSAGESVALELAGTLQDAVKVIRDEITAGQVHPLVTRMGEFLQAAGLTVKVYCQLQTDTGRAAFDLGWERDGSRISMDAMSGGESALFGAALAFALVVLDKSPLKILVVEADNLDEQNLTRMIGALGKLAGPAGIGNVFVATCHAPTELDHGWKLFQMNGTR